ncbi:MAG: hypothetical protein CUN56_00875 [Phototrophicales bacterium]|nr:MAG: hypothetical protein CUN56_00875 [Phototrophicales bacterium]RMG74438.1 MAG: hypothetical protein D6711_08900 [Chloroflexota bacterium]
MKRMFLLWMIVIILSACGLFETQRTNMMSQSTVHTDIDSLFRWFDLSRFPEPLQVQWVQKSMAQAGSELPGPTDYYVLALLTYDEPTATLATQLNLPSRQDVYVEDSLLTDSWLPDEILTAFERTPENYLRYTGTAYTALLQPPLGYGYVLFIDHYVLIYGATL